MIGLTRAFVLCIVMCVLLAMNSHAYSTKFDDINIDSILENPRLRNQYVGCLLNTGPCITSAARFLKEIYAEAFYTNCKQCTTKQMDILDKITDWFTKNEPDTWKLLVEVAIEEARKRNQN